MFDTMGTCVGCCSAARLMDEKGMLLGYSITKGIGMAILSYVVIAIICYVAEIIKYAVSKDANKQKPKFEISIVTIIALLFIVYFFVPTVL